MLIQSLCDYRCQQCCVTLCQSLSKVDGNFRSVHKKVTDHACHVPPVIHGPCPLAHQLMFMVGMLTMSKWFPSKKIVPGKTLVLLSKPCHSMQSAHDLCKLFHGFPPFASVPRLCCTPDSQSITDQHVRRVRCGRKPICWGRVHAQVRLCIPKAVARPIHLILKLSFVCCSPANGANVGSSPAQAVSVTFLFWFNTDLSADLDRPHLCTAEIKRKRANTESTYSQANL